MFSKKAARRYLQSMKKGCTVKEFLTMCGCMGVWYDEILGTELEYIFYTLCPNSAVTAAAHENRDII